MEPIQKLPPTFLSSLTAASCEAQSWLIPNLWYRGDVACLFADSGMGKSILAVQFGDKLARQGIPVLYYDFEMTSAAMKARYASDQGDVYPFADLFYRPEVDFSAFTELNATEKVLEQVRRDLAATHAEVVIIDNLTVVCPGSETGLEATRFMFSLKTLCQATGSSLLVLAHTPKRDMTQPITQNDLAGSKRLFNFFDTVWALGKIDGEPDGRYFKQLKVRVGRLRYGEENVCMYKIMRDADTGYLRLEYMAKASERDMLPQPAMAGKQKGLGKPLKSIVVALRGEKIPFHKIADILGISASTAHKLANEA